MITTARIGKNGPGAHQLKAASQSSRPAATAMTHTGTRRCRSEVTQPSIGACSVPSSGMAAQATR